ncbi:MAG: YraN family protein [Gluconacetobacter diazotrophicus]|nr:YraN family protein [Gluconacetobacter diazotrophicus]
MGRFRNWRNGKVPTRNEPTPQPSPQHVRPAGPSELAAKRTRIRGHANWNAGLRAEVLAARALERDGWTVLRRRARTAAGEIDLVAERSEAAGPLLAFVEVKRRGSLDQAAAALAPRQRGRLLRAAELLLAAEPAWNRHAVRFDLLLVDRHGATRRIRDAFRQEN